VDPRNHVLKMGVQILHGKEEKEGRLIVKYRHCAMSCEKTAVPNEMSFRLCFRIGQRNHCIGLGADENGQFYGERVAHCKL